MENTTNTAEEITNKPDEEQTEVKEAVEEVVETIESENSKEEPTQPSETESADSYSDAEDENAENCQNRRRSVNSESESEKSVILEREEGDGQESAPSRKVDDDEDKKNPQYIPKRGTFYEHDDRTVDDAEGEKVEEAEKGEKEGKKKIWTDKKEKWSHDKFIDNEQGPKSRDELISIYGYDIRNEDGPPRARRRRRYGRGPNKYTRNWEDEDAYNKAVPIKKDVKIKKKRDKPIRGFENSNENQQNQKNDEGSSGRQSADSHHDNSNRNYQMDKPVRPPPQPSAEISASKVTERQNNKNQRVGTGRVVKPAREIKESDYKGFTRPRNYAMKPPIKENKERDIIQTQSYTNKKNIDIEKDMFKLSLNDQSHSKNMKTHNNNRQTSVPPRLQGEQKGSKRYSSIRQRSLPEAANPLFNQQHNYYNNAGNDYNQQQNPVTSQAQQSQPMLQHQHQQHPPQTQMPTIPPPPLPTIPQQVPVTSTPLPPQFGNPFPAPPAFLQPPPPPFIPQQTPPIINYGQQFAPAQPPYQGFQQPFNPVSQPAEIFQPPGGITYYSAQEQQAAQRAALQKRPKAAIPIVPPPPLEPRGRGRASNAEVAMPNPSDVIIENNAESSNFEDVAIQQQ